MKKLQLIIILFIAFQSISFAQADESKSFVWLFDGTIIYGKVKWNPNQPLKRYFYVDTIQIHKKYVKFYNDTTGFYANSVNANWEGVNSFAKRILKGKVNLYLFEIDGSVGGVDASGMSYSTYATKVNYYYNIGDGDLKVTKRKNIMQDFKDHKEAYAAAKAIFDRRDHLGIKKAFEIYNKE